MNNDSSYVETGRGHTAFVGPDATQLFAVTVLRSAIRLYVKTGMKASRGYTPAAMRDAASRVTGKPYKRSDLAKAGDDLTAWIDAMKAALPIIPAPNREG